MVDPVNKKLAKLEGAKLQNILRIDGGNKIKYYFLSVHIFLLACYVYKIYSLI